MTISSTAPSIEYTTSGTVVDFSVPFEFFDPEDLRVRLYPDPADDDAFDDLIYGQDFSATGGDGKPGSITLLAVPAPGQRLRIQSNLGFGQVVAYQKHGPFPAKAHEEALDRLALQIKQAAYNAGVGGGDPTVGVLSFNGRDGNVLPINADYSSFYKPLSWFPTWSEVTGKPTSFPPETHTHTWLQITGKPSTYPPSAHQHPWTDIINKPATYPPAGTQFGALQFYDNASTMGGADLLRYNTLAAGANTESGVLELFLRDTLTGTFLTTMRIGYGLADGVALVDADTRAVGMRGSTLKMLISDLKEGEALVMGPNGSVLSRPYAEPPVVDTVEYTGADVAVPVAPAWATIPVTLQITANSQAGLARSTIVVPVSADGNQDFIMTAEPVINGVPTGELYPYNHTDNTADFTVVATSYTRNDLSAGDTIQYRVQRDGGPANVVVSTASKSFRVDIVHFGSSGEGSATYLGDLLDVSNEAPNDAEVLTWNAGAGEWQPQPGGGGSSGVTSFNGRAGIVNPIQADYSSFYKDIAYVPAWGEITGRPSTFPPSAHGHVISDVTGLQTALDGKAPTAHTHDWTTDITGKPTEFPPENHTHVIGDVTGLQSALDSKAPLDDPAFTGDPTSNGELLATQPYVQNEVHKPLRSSATATTLQLTDSGRTVWMTAAADVTVPPESSVAFPNGTRINVGNGSTGTVGIVAGSGVTLRYKGGSMSLTTQYAGVTLEKIGTNEWWLVGDLA